MEHTYATGIGYLKITSTPTGYLIQHWNHKQEFCWQEIRAYKFRDNGLLCALREAAVGCGLDCCARPWSEVWVEGISDPDIKHIPFIDSKGRVRFCIPGGCGVTLEKPDGRKNSYVCRYIDRQRFLLGGYTYYIEEFWENLRYENTVCYPEHIPFAQEGRWSFGEHDLTVYPWKYGSGEWAYVLDRYQSPYSEEEIIHCDGNVLDARNRILDRYELPGYRMVYSRC